ncbi:hypothetical protein RZN05_18775 [Sphingomonas sp. HF-S4]|uniref:Uncharacterized protein n=1 Tax=Sphingomonas agrestis TaxID=3080540 RepID=A0ABU3YCD0_9SPHN|nr:hypothetical protein [Sphingomonas sp. HF-S4]MDV3459050.1 hypothetical protein [Sphingomonas sp. HF-S4]
MAGIDDSDKQEVDEAIVFTRNFKKPGSGLESASGGVRATSSCDSNCDCYIETEWTTAAGIAGYRYGS